MTYPKIITIENDKMKKLLIEKSNLVNTGRGISEDIEKLEIKMEVIDNQMKEAEKKVDTAEFKDKEKEITDRMESCIKDMNTLQEEIKSKMLAQTPQELGDKYDELKKEKEKLENDRNKVALKIQKQNDKIIPLSRKLMKPYLEDDYDDFDTIKLEKDKIVASIFNHIDTFKANFKNK